MTLEQDNRSGEDDAGILDGDAGVYAGPGGNMSESELVAERMSHEQPATGDAPDDLKSYNRRSCGRV